MDYLNSAPLRDPMPGRYPTKDEILEEPMPRYRHGLFNALAEWKMRRYSGWRHLAEYLQLEYLGELAEAITDLYNAPHVDVLYGDIACYVPSEETIYLNNPSIVTLLHELSHHLFGTSEYHACRFSVWLFKKCFTSSYEKLVWNGHLLSR